MTTSIRMTNESTSGSGHISGLETGSLVTVPGSVPCSDDEQINRDLLQLRKHLALLATTPTKQSSEPEVIYAKVIKQPKNVTSLARLFQQIPDSWKNAASTSASKSKTIVNNNNNLPRLSVGLSLKQSIIKHDGNRLLIDRNHFDEKMLSLSERTLQCQNVYDCESACDTYRLAAELLRDNICQLKSRIQFNSILTSTPTSSSSSPSSPRLSSQNLPVIFVFDQNKACSLESPSTIERCLSSTGLTLMLCAIKWMFDETLNNLESQHQQRHSYIVPKLALSAFYITSTRQVSLIESSNPKPVHSTSSSLSLSSSSSASGTSTSVNSFQSYQQQCDNAQMAIDILEQCLNKLQTLICDNKNEEFIFSFSIYFVRQLDTSQKESCNPPNQCALSIVKCFPTIESLSSSSLSSSSPSSSNSELLSLWRILQIFAQSNSIATASSSVSALKASAEKDSAGARKCTENDDNNDYNHYATVVNKSADRNLYTFKSDLLSNKPNKHLRQILSSKCNIQRLFANLIKDNTVNLSLVVNLSLPSSSSSTSSLTSFYNEWKCLCSLSKAMFLNDPKTCSQKNNESRSIKPESSKQSKKLSANIKHSRKASLSASEHAGTASSEHSFNTVIFRNQKNSSKILVKQSKKEYSSIDNDSIKESKDTENKNTQCLPIRQHSSHIRKNKSHRNSVYSHETSSSMDTSKNRHRRSTHLQNPKSFHLHSKNRSKRGRSRCSSSKTSKMSDYSIIQKIANKGPGTESWAQEIWIDGPLAQDYSAKEHCHSGSAKSTLKRNTYLSSKSRKQSLHTSNDSNDELDCDQRQIRLQQWIVSNSKQQQEDLANVQYLSGIEASKNMLKDCDARTELTLDGMPNMAEPPKQLRLEQFLAQLSTITANSNVASDSSSSMMLFSDDTRQQAAKVVTNVPMMALDNSSTDSLKAQSKLKRNTTSTTTSGHGTISEGECSSIINQASPMMLITENGSSKRSIRQQNSSPSVSTTPGSGVEPGVNGPVQRQQPTTSSGYESTIQDDVDDIDDLESGSNRNKVRLTHQVSANKSSHGIELNSLPIGKTTVSRIACTDLSRGTVLLTGNTENNALFGSDADYHSYDSQEKKQFCSLLFCCAMRK